MRETKYMILLVEDVEETRMGLALLLEMRGYGVVSAVNEEMAVSVARSERTDLILLEMAQTQDQMFETGRRIRERVNLRDAPIAVISPANELDADYVRVGSNEYVTMMDGFEQLETLLGDVLPVRPN